MTEHRTRYDPISRAFHWLTAVLVLVAFVLGPEHFGRLMRQGLDPANRPDIVWHEAMGIAVAVLTLLRLLWTAVRPSAPQFNMPHWMHRLSGLVQLSLWLLLLLTPMSALLALASDGHPLTLPGGLRVDELPLVVSSSLVHLADWGDVHGFLADAILWLSGLHALAAIWHHRVLRDGVLLSMLPQRR